MENQSQRKCKYPPANPYQINANGPTKAFYEQLLIEFEKATVGTKPAASTTYIASQENTQSRLCLLTKAEKNLSVYRQLDNCVATATAKGTDLLKTVEVTNLLQAETNLKKQFDDVLKAIKEANKKLDEVEVASNYLQDAFEEPRNIDSRQALERSIKNSKELIDKIAMKADECNDRIDYALEEAVITVGKQTFLNISGLNEFIIRLTDGVKLFTEDIASNVKTGNEHVTETQKNLTEAIKQQVASQIDFFEASINLDGLEKVKKFIDKPEQPKQGINYEPVDNNNEADALPDSKDQQDSDSVN